MKNKLISSNSMGAATANKENSDNEHSFCSRPNLIHIRYVWKIENFSYISDIRSTPIFGTKDCSSILCRMDILFDRPAVYLHPQVVSTAAENRYKFKYSILNDEGHILHSAASDELYAVQTKFDTNTMDNLLYSRLLFKYPESSASLTLHCDIYVLIGIVDIIHSPVADKKEYEENVEEDEIDGESFEIIDLSKLLDSGHNSDVTLVANGKEFKVHKGLLALRSDVFAAMFQQRDSLNRVVIEDFDHNVIREMLYFIYTGKSPNIDTMTLALLAAADKFALTTLKTMCESMLDLDLNVSSAVRTLILADRQGAKTLKSRTMEIIKANISTISKTKEWADLYSNHPHLIIELISLSNS